jgi:excinuclease ABC subunit A
MVQGKKENGNASKSICIRGARVHNLKNLSVDIPHNRFVVITGLSGSGKSSLAFDTLYAEGQRRYVESLSSYARQFLGRMSKPEVDSIKGIAPAIAIEQKVKTHNPRSTVGTSTEIYDYLKLLFARTGKTYSPVSGEEVKRHNVSNVVDFVVALPEGTRLLICSPVILKNGRSLHEHLEVLLQQGFTRMVVNGEIKDTEACIDDTHLKKPESVRIVIDRLSVQADRESMQSRLADSVQTAFFEGNGDCQVMIMEGDKLKSHHFSNRFERDGISFEEPSVNLFTFNNPFGACKTCEGFGSIIGIDEDLVIPDKSLSVYQEAIACWKGEKMGEWREELVMNAYKFDFPVHKPVHDLTEEQRKLLWTGNEYFHGLNDFFAFVEEQKFKIQYRVMQARYRGKTLCPDCNGTRLRKDAAYVKVGEKSIVDLLTMPVDRVLEFFKTLKLDKHQAAVAKRLMPEITNRLEYLQDVGLGYLTLNRASNSLSGGESQRINLATALGSSLVGSLYILDEPSVGLHPRDSEKLIMVLKKLRDIGNTVIVVEHDEDIIKASDQVIDIGPEAGKDGGHLVYSGPVQNIGSCSDSYTGKYLSGRLSIEVPDSRRPWKEFIRVCGARENNLRGIDVDFPLHTLTVVSGVSGSGKTTLVKKILYNALRKIHGGTTEKSGKFSRLEGDINRISAVELVDQNPIGRSSRSNPVTYVKAYDEIRALYADQQLSKMRGYKPGYFSFNTEGGRCEECQGDGFVKIEMQFMADITLVCESCGGRRFKDEVLDVKYRDKSITDILDMTISEAIEFFDGERQKTAIERRIVERLQPLMDVGLGYVRMGQSSSTLSGGEAQRLKLASFLTKGASEHPTLFIFDEPSTGLHVHDISKLYAALEALVEHRHTVIIIEHNLEIIKCADWVIDLGPGGGEHGGNLVFAGTPEQLIRSESITGQYLKAKM